MVQIRKSSERGYFKQDWLEAYHSFSFADYYDPKHMGFHSLRVINEDMIAPGGGFPTHSHKDMEIITFVISGALRHCDSMGNESIIRPGEIQYMSAGSGVTHSEFNPSTTESTRLLQIWILPSVKGLEPRYAQNVFSTAEGLSLLASYSGDSGEDNSILIRQKARIYRGFMSQESQIDLPCSAQNGYYLLLLNGKIKVQGVDISSGDAAMLETENQLSINKLTNIAEFLLFDLS